MNTDVPALSSLAQKILKLLSQKEAGDEYLAINKNQYDNETIEHFFSVLTELKLSGLVSFYQDYKYVPYENFGDLTSKQYGKMDILLRINPPKKQQ